MQSSTKKIDDFGIKIGGARKDLWRERGGLQYEDLQEMSDLEIQQYVVKKEIWNLKPKDFENMVFVEGRDREAAYFVKKVYGAIPSKPKIPTYLTRKEDISKQLKAYIDMVQGIKKVCYEIKTKEDIGIPTKDGTTTVFYQKFLPLFAPNQEHFGRVIRLYDEYTIQVSSKLFSAFQTPIFTLQREIKKAKFCYTEDEKIKATYSVKMFSSEEKSGTLFPKSVSNKYVDFGGTLIYKIGENITSVFCCNSFKDTTNVEDYIDQTYVLLNEDNRIIDYNFDTVEEAYQKAKIYDNEKQKYASGKSESGRKKKYIPKQFKMLDRKGAEYRSFKHANANDFLDVFQFKGGEFGNWVNDKERQASLDYCYDALMDLSDSLEISRDSVTLGHQLNIAFGARGHGSALAHFDPLYNVINLTKMKGAGSLGHEWIHALDFYLGTQYGIHGLATEDRVTKYPKEFTNLIKSLTIKTIVSEKPIEDEAYKNAKLKYDLAEKNLKQSLISVLQPLSQEKLETCDVEKYVEILVKDAKKGESRPNPRNFVEHRGRICWETQKSEGIQKIEEMILKDFDIKSINKNSLNHIMMRQDSVWLTYQNLKRECGISEKNNIYTKEVHTDFYKDAQKMDKSWAKTDNGYWASTCEMLARAGAAYLYEKAKEKGIKNDYLLGHALNAVNDVEKGTLFLYPKGEEMRTISEKFDAFFDMLKEKELLKPLTEDEKSVGMLYTPIKIDVVKNIEDKSDDMIIDEYGEFKLFDEEKHSQTAPFVGTNQYGTSSVDYKNVCKEGKDKQEKKIEMPTLF